MTTVFRDEKFIIEKKDIDELNDLIVKAKSGDKESLLEIIRSFSGIIIDIFGRYGHRVNQYGLDLDDIYQYAIELLIRCVKTIDLSRGISLTTYYMAFAEKNIYNKFRTNNTPYKYNPRAKNNDAPVYMENVGEEIDSFSSKFNLQENVNRKLDEEILVNIIKKKLSPIQSDVVCLYYGLQGNEPRSHREIAEITKTSHENTRQHLLKSTIKLKHCKELREFYGKL